MRALAAVYLLAPQIPMLFMGEEWAAPQTFPFFCDFHEELGEAVRQGRRSEFAKFPEFQDEASRALIPDPNAEATFRSAKLDWGMLVRAPHSDRLCHYRELLATRHREIVPRLGRTLRRSGVWETYGAAIVRVRWPLEDGGRLVLNAVLSATGVEGSELGRGQVVWSEGEVDRERGQLGPWSVLWAIEGPITGD
jgi:1,4-alpha-glucan branching enzyme